MRLLFICYDHPSPSLAGSHRVLYSIKHLSKKYGHDMTLVAFKLPKIEYADLTPYCRVETIDISFRPSFQSPKTVLSALKNIIFGGFSFLNFSYSPEMARKIEALLENNIFDVLIIDHPAMLNYVLGKNKRVVLLEAFALAEITRMYYQMERNWIKKIIRLLHHYQTRNYAQTYKALAMSIAVSPEQRNMVISHCPSLDIEVIPYGVDTDYLRTVDTEDRLPNLTITGGMDRLHSVKGILWFYNEVYPLIKASVPQVNLYIVGSNPRKELLRLVMDKSVTVTGYVDDLRSHLSRAWVVVAPLLEGFGVKVRVLQAMAVGKAVVSNSMVTTGIDVTPGKDIIIADSPAEFAERVIELMNDKQLREKIGANARQLMETEHSWEKLTDRLNELLEKTVKAK